MGRIRRGRVSLYPPPAAHKHGVEGMRVKREIYIRVTDAARHILATGATVRQCAERFGVSKPTIHKDMRLRLKQVDPGLFAEVSRVLEKNRSERHLRGGMATRRKYAKRRESALSG